MGYLAKYWGRYWKKFIIALFFLSLEAAADLLQPAIMSKIIDEGVAYSDLSQIEKYGLLMLLVTLIGAVGACLRNILSVHVSQHFAMDLRQDLYIKIQKLSFRNIDKIGNASLITRLTNDVTRMQTFVNGTMRIMMKAPLVGIGSVFMAIHLNPKLSLVLLVLIPVIAFLILMNVRVSYPYFRKVQSALDHVNLSMQQYLAGIRVVKVFNRTNYEKEQFGRINNQLGAASTLATRVGSTFGPLIQFSVNAGIIAILLFGGIGVNNGSMQVGSIIALTNYMTQILFAIMMVNNAFQMFVRAKASAERIGSVMLEKNEMIFPEPGEKEESAAGQETGSHIRFMNVSFSYNNQLQESEPVLRKINLEIKRGATLGIIGPIASGKSTLVQLIPRFYDPDEGSVLMNGKNIKMFSEDDLRQRIAVVPQKTLLFSGTIKENIRWGNEQASDQAIYEAAKMAQADHFIQKMPQGYNAVIGQGGVNLSGGQKQRIAIARALIRKPELLILDDATSALDARTERKLRDQLAQYAAQLTCIIIAQRISSIKDADQIIVMENGQVQAEGTHEELLKTSAMYQKIDQSQMGREAEHNV